MFKSPLLILCLITFGLFAQQSKIDLPDPLDLYQEKVSAPNNSIYIGKVDPLSMNSRSTHPFFETRGWQKSTVIYNGITYKNLDALYDINRGVVILKYPEPGKVVAVALNMNRVDNFSIGDNAFRKPKYKGKEGFFEVIFEGEEMNLIVNRQKTEETTNTEVTYVDENVFYIERNEELVLLNNKKVLKEMFTNYKEITARIKSLNSNLKFSKFNEEKLVGYMKAFDEATGEI